MWLRVSGWSREAGLWTEWPLTPLWEAHICTDTWRTRRASHAKIWGKHHFMCRGVGRKMGKGRGAGRGHLQRSQSSKKLRVLEQKTERWEYQWSLNHPDILDIASSWNLKCDEKPLENCSPPVEDPLQVQIHTRSGEFASYARSHQQPESRSPIFLHGNRHAYATIPRRVLPLNAGDGIKDIDWV